MFLLGVALARGEEPFPRSVPGAALRAYEVYVAARERWAAHSTNLEAGWQLGRACFEWADYATNNAQRAALAEEGIAACRAVRRVDSELAAGRYYLAMNLGQLARTKLLGALSLVGELEGELKVVRRLDPLFDYAGADRSLGRLYLEAPGWPVSVGNQGRARQHLLRAVELVPDYPGNRLVLLEAAIGWKDRKLIEREVEGIEKMWSKARERLQGPAWVVSWLEWEQRWREARRRAGVTTP